MTSTIEVVWSVDGKTCWCIDPHKLRVLRKKFNRSYDISTEYYIPWELDISLQDTNPQYLCVSEDEDFLLIYGNTSDRIIYYELGEGGEASYVPSKSIDCTDFVLNPVGMELSEDGTFVALVMDEEGSVCTWNLSKPDSKPFIGRH